jgi:chromosome segregation ATPase
MNNRPAAPTAPGAYRQDDERRRDEARVVGMQHQIDELRQAVRELASRQTRGEEQVKQFEGGAAQNRLLLEQIRQESHQSAQARALDENRTRQQIDDLESRLEDIARPIRSLQAHVSELLEAARHKTDDTGAHLRRFEELQGQIEHLSAIGDRTMVITHQLRDSIDTLREESDQIRRDTLRVDDAIKIVDQEARRRAAEIAQVGENTAARIDELRSDIAHGADQIELIQRSIVHIDPTLAELQAIDVALRQDLVRFQAQAIERHELLLERAEDVRQETDARFDEVRQAQEQRYERLTERIEELAEAHRDLGYRISSLSHQLDELRQTDNSLRRDLWHINEQRVRLRLEQAQQELDLVANQRREVEAPGGPSRPMRQRRAPTQSDH